MGDALKADRDVVLAAVKKNGHALLWAARELKADIDIVLNAVLSNEYAIDYASDELKADIKRNAAIAGVDVRKYAYGVLHPVLFQIQSIKRVLNGVIRVSCSTMGGIIETVDVDTGVESTTADLRARLAAIRDMSVAAINIVLKSGQLCKIGSDVRLL